METMRTKFKAIKPLLVPSIKLESLATELASIRASGFSTSDRMERWFRRLLAFSAANQLDVAETYSRVVSLACQIREDDNFHANRTLATMARKAV